VPRLTRWTALPLLIISVIIAIKDFIEPTGWNFVGTLICLVLVLVAPIIGTFILLIPSLMKFLAKNYGVLNDFQKTQLENHEEIQYESKQEFIFN
jgi:membrane protein YdbS with pleckstrin-like domain